MVTGNLIYRFEDAVRVLELYGEFMATAPDDFHANVTLNNRVSVAWRLDVLQLWRAAAGSLKECEKSNPTGDLQVATDGSGTDCLRGALVSSVLALAPRCRGATRGTRPAGRPHHGLAMGSALRAGTRAEAAASSQADQQILACR